MPLWCNLFRKTGKAGFTTKAQRHKEDSSQRQSVRQRAAGSTRRLGRSSMMRARKAGRRDRLPRLSRESDIGGNSSKRGVASRAVPGRVVTLWDDPVREKIITRPTGLPGDELANRTACALGAHLQLLHPSCLCGAIFCARTGNAGSPRRHKDTKRIRVRGNPSVNVRRDQAAGSGCCR